MKILCIGHSSWDITVPVDDYPIENTKYRYNEKYSAGGGPASNAAYLLGKWGVDTVIASTIGSDDFGTNIKKEFQDIHVNTDYIETSYDKDTSLSFILINKKNGSRTVFNVASEYPALKKLSYDFTPDIIFTDGHDYGASQNAISTYQNAITIIDAGRVTPELLELCKYIKYIVKSDSIDYEAVKKQFMGANVIICTILERVTIGGKSLQHWFLENTVEQDWLSVMEEYNAFQAFVSNKKWNKKKLRIVKDIYNEISFDYKNHEIRS